VTVLRVLRGLEGRGLVARVPAPGSRRNLSITLSAEGEALLTAAQKPAEQAYQRLLAPLAPERQHQLIELLQELTGGLEHEARAPLVAPVQV
jgi:DNA-binding MarR family transcriptional regulator